MACAQKKKNGTCGSPRDRPRSRWLRTVADLSKFLDALINWTGADGQPELFGRMFLANLWACYEEKMVERPDVAKFLSICATLWDDAQAASPAASSDLRDLISNVCRGAPSFGSENFLRANRQLAAPPPASRFTTVVSLETFSVHHVDKNSRVLRGPLTSPRPKLSAADLAKCREEIEYVTKKDSWVKPGATLGNPSIPDNCWVSFDDHDEGEAAAVLRAALRTADDARDELGLIHREIDDHLVALAFDAQAAASITDFEMARPTFADLGNSRFCVQPCCDRGREMATNGWGCTFHLKHFAERLREPTGLPERVTSAMPLSQLGRIRVRYLGAITLERGKGVEDNDDAFLAHLLGSRSIDDIKTNILRTF